MPYKITHFSDQAIVELSLSGVVPGEDLREATSKCIAIQKESQVKKFLVQANDSAIIATLLDIIDLPEKQYHKEGLDRGTRIAVIFPTSISAQEAADFFETVCLNRGWNAKVHPDRQSALAWLASPEVLG